jgi:hypothetical protein
MEKKEKESKLDVQERKQNGRNEVRGRVRKRREGDPSTPIPSVAVKG